MLDKEIQRQRRNIYERERQKQPHVRKRIKVAVQKRRWDQKRRLVAALGGKCVDCGYDGHPLVFDFDHIDPSTKIIDIGAKLRGWSYKRLLDEAKKCVLRCANCHRIKTWGLSQ